MTALYSCPSCRTVYNVTLAPPGGWWGGTDPGSHLPSPYHCFHEGCSLDGRDMLEPVLAEVFAPSNMPHAFNPGASTDWRPCATCGLAYQHPVHIKVSFEEA